jgi:hypothetical protein
MNLKLTALIFLSGAVLLRGQGTFVYDQQSLGPGDGSAGLNRTPFGQSFTPMLNSIGFIDLQLGNGNSDSVVAVNLRSDSITGPILGTSESSIVPGSSSGIYDFLFSNPVSLTPGTLYFFEPVIVSGGVPQSVLLSTHYPGGNAIIDGSQFPNDLWFQEGVVSTVPEPSLAALLLIGSGVLYCRRRKWRVGKLCNGNG